MHAIKYVSEAFEKKVSQEKTPCLEAICRVQTFQ